MRGKCRSKRRSISSPQKTVIKTDKRGEEEKGSFPRRVEIPGEPRSLRRRGEEAAARRGGGVGQMPVGGATTAGSAGGGRREVTSPAAWAAAPLLPPDAPMMDGRSTPSSPRSPLLLRRPRLGSLSGFALPLLLALRLPLRLSSLAISSTFLTSPSFPALPHSHTPRKESAKRERKMASPFESRRVHPLRRLRPRPQTLMSCPLFAAIIPPHARIVRYSV